MATYARKEDAEKRARRIEGQSPSFKAEVYSPSKSAKPYYLVVLGSNLSEQEAIDCGLERKVSPQTPTLRGLIRNRKASCVSSRGLPRKSRPHGNDFARLRIRRFGGRLLFCFRSR